MRKSTRSTWLVGMSLTAFSFTGGVGQAPSAVAPDCSTFALDGYRLGMRGDEILAVRSVTLHTEGQAQVIVPGKFQGVLVLDALNRLEKWDARYANTTGDHLRAEMRERHGEPTSDVTGHLSGDEPNGIRQRRTIWRSKACDALIVVYEHTNVLGTMPQAVSATLARPAILTPGLAEMKTLFH